MKIEQIIQREKRNTQHIYLYPSGKFYSAYDLSAFLFTTHIWPTIKPLYKYVKGHGDCIRVGFPMSSLSDKVLEVAHCENFAWREESMHEAELVDHFDAISEAQGHPRDPNGLRIPSDIDPYDLDQKDTIVVIGPVPVDQDAYLKWRSDILAEHNRIKLMMQPFYGGKPVFKRCYDLMLLLISCVHHFPKDVQQLLGSRLADEAVSINTLFFRICDQNDPAVTLAGIRDIRERLNSIRFLLRICYEQGHINNERNIALMAKMDEVERQLHLWQGKLDQEK